MESQLKLCWFFGVMTKKCIDALKLISAESVRTVFET